MDPFRRFSEQPLRLPKLGQHVRSASDPPIYGFNDDRASIVAETVASAVGPRKRSRGTLEQALSDTAFNEARRLEQQRDQETAERLGEYRGLLRRIPKMRVVELESELDRLATGMAWDVAGNFDPRVHALASRFAPRLVTAAMQPSRLPSAFLEPDASKTLRDMLSVEGDVARLRRLEHEATLVYVPTHSSNLDSIVLAQALEVSGLSPVLYGAGKNLFTNPLLSFFMHNLGAYRVDRRIRAELYKDVLKSYARATVRRGYHGLFFPGGTRSRSNLVERKLKLGLAGSAVEAFAERRVRGDLRPIVFVPTTINYALVLEAETLVDDWLVEEGKNRYLIDDDEFSRADRWLDFFRKLVAQRAACIIRFGEPLDPFGNPTDERGRSLGPAGRILDPGGYVTSRGVVRIDTARDAAYARELGDRLALAYARETVVMPTALVAHVLFRTFVRETPGLDLFARLRLRNEIRVRHDVFARDVEATRDRLRNLVARGEVHAHADCLRGEASALVERVLETFAGYHRRLAARGEGRDVVVDDPALLLYYQNRLVRLSHALAAPEDADVARVLAAIGERR